MSLLFSPNGSLNVATDPSDLPESADQQNLSSGAMVRCKNLRINQQGIAKTRDGSAKLNPAPIASVSWLEVQAGIYYAFGGGSIYRDGTRIASGLTDAQWTSIQYNAYNDTTQNIFALNGADTKRIENGVVYEWGLAAPTAAPALSVGSATGLTGTYNAKYTYVRKVGAVVVAESNPSPAGNATVLADQKLTVTVTAPTDTQVTHIRLYRTLASGLIYDFDQDIAVGSTTFTSSIADASLGDEVETDHDRPPAGSFVFGPAFDGTCFIIKNNLLYYSKPKQPEYWPALYYIEISAPQFPGQTAVFSNGQVYYFTKNDIFYVQGTGAGVFLPLPMKAKTGAQSIRGAVPVPGKGIFHTGPDGIYLFSSGSDIKISEDTLEPLFRGEDIQDMPGVSSMETSWLFVFRNHLYFGYTSIGYDYPTNVLVMNLDTNRLAYYAYNDGDVIEIRAPAIDETNKRFLIGDTAGFVRVIESPSYVDDEESPVEWEVQSKDYTLSTRLHFPRWTKYDVDASEADSCTGAFLLGGAIHQTHTITGNRDTRRRLIGTGNGNRASIRISGTGPVSIYAAESE